MLESIITAALICGAIAIILGIVIAIAAKVLYVKPDERIKIIFEMLPHFNCGSCGTPGCEAFATELVAGNMQPKSCRPCKPDRRVEIEEKLEELLNQES